ncbi:MAG: EF-P lysine aminoacylase GenX [Desulfofustis sp.]|nr:EF-P lysine aminoacylase GenX [Desulfofustis sp.]
MLDIQGLRFRAALFHSIRTFFRSHDFLEVDTPVRLPLVLPESTIEPIPTGTWYLQPSPEQCMKRLLALGCEKLFQICPCFRAGERGRRHLEEFTMLEWYRRDADYQELMKDCRSLLRFVVDDLNGQREFHPTISRSWFGTGAVDRQWQRIGVAEAFAQWAPVPVGEALVSGRFDEIISIDIEPRLGREIPCFLCDYPAECASLALLNPDDPAVAERFELYIDGVELANGFSELTDSGEQRQRFRGELELIKKRGGRVQRMPEQFLADLDRVDRAAGIAFGLDRLLMLLQSAESIEAVVSFSPDDWD